MKKHIVSHIAIYLLSAVMIFFGIYHLKYPEDMMKYAYIPTNLPNPLLLVRIVGIVFILAALSFIFNKFVKIAAYLLAAMLLSFAFIFHLDIYRNAGSDELKVNALINILKDTALAAFALHIAGSADSHGMKF
ncbi:MAG TPA: MauE/DoxX family redox-associated membrane protein [Chitinophagaceae bacterium]